MEQMRTLHVTGLPATVTTEDLRTFFTREFGPLLTGSKEGADASRGPEPEENQSPTARTASPFSRFGVRLYNGAQRTGAPYSVITFSEAAPANVAAEAATRCSADNRHLTGMEGWPLCVVRLQRQPKHHRLKAIESNIAHKAARKEAKEARAPAWRLEMLDKFPCRESTLDQHTQVSELSPELLMLITQYLAYRFQGDAAEVTAALQSVWQNHPKSLRVKELFETVEALSLISQQLDIIRSKGQCTRSRSAAVLGRSQRNNLPSKEDVDAPVDGNPGLAIKTIFDMASGHGLLGVLLAYRFADIQVICVDLEQREAFDHYVGAFKTFGIPDSASLEDEPLSNIEFKEGDIADVTVPPSSFVVCVHACNEANKIAVDRAQEAQAGYAAIPCCIPDKLYCVEHIRYAGVEARYAAMVGVMAGTYGAHSIACIDRRITNRHMCIFGGYPYGGTHQGGQDSSRTHRGRRHNKEKACCDHHD